MKQAKIDKILESQADEREIVENGKLFKKALDIILIIINILWIMQPFVLIPFNLEIVTIETISICINFCALIVNLITFIFIMKTFKKSTFGGSINKTTNNLSTLFVLNILNIVGSIINIAGLSKTPIGYITLSDFIFISWIVITITWLLGISAYLTRKYNKQKSI